MLSYYLDYPGASRTILLTVYRSTTIRSVVSQENQLLCNTMPRQLRTIAERLTIVNSHRYKNSSEQLTKSLQRVYKVKSS